MSDKPFEKLNELDQQLRRTLPVGMRGGNTVATAEVDVTIQKVCAFEIFNTRRYHNYETWSDGYVVEGQGVRVEREDLDDAVKDWCRVVRERRNPDYDGKHWVYCSDPETRRAEHDQLIDFRQKEQNSG